MFVLGVVLLVLGVIFDFALLWAVGLALLAAGALLYLLGTLGRPVGPRNHYW